MILSQQKL